MQTVSLQVKQGKLRDIMVHSHFVFLSWVRFFLLYYQALESLINKTLIGLEYHFYKQLRQEPCRVYSLVAEIKSTLFLSMFHLVKYAAPGVCSPYCWCRAQDFLCSPMSLEKARLQHIPLTLEHLGTILNLELLVTGNSKALSPYISGFHILSDPLVPSCMFLSLQGKDVRRS